MEEREPLRDWSLAILGALEPVIIRGSLCARQQGGEGFPRLSRNPGRAAARKPGNPERDVLTRLIQGEDNGERLTSKGIAAQLHLPAQRRA